MRNTKREEEQTESLLEKKFRFQLRMKQAQDDVLFFGLAVMFALCMTQSMFNIQ